MTARLSSSLLAAAIGLLAGAAAIAIGGGDPITAYTALAEGAMGSAYGWSEVAVKACPLVISGLAVALAFRAGLWNIGAEGQLVAGALVAVCFATNCPQLPTALGVSLTLLAAVCGGALVAAIAALLKLRRGVDEVIGTIMLNFIVLGIVGYLVHGPMMEASGNYPQSEALPGFTRLPRLFQGMRIHAGSFAVVALVPLCAWGLYRSRFGYVVRAVGANPVATELAGFSVGRYLLATFTASGALAGLAGGMEVASVTYRMYENFSPGYGYTAIAVALLGRLDPWGVLLAGLLFGILEAGSMSMQRVAGVSAVIVSLIQGCVIFALAAIEYSRAESSS